MDFSDSCQQFDIFQLYCRFCEIKSRKDCPRWEADTSDSEKAKFSREAMVQLSKFVDCSFNMRVSIFDELRKLMDCQNMMGEFAEFSKLYDFVFFMCREKCQKSISVSRAIAAWKLALAGRFRLLNQWCDFVEENHRYNISEDTWHQVLAFSRCVHEDLEGYDPEGAWPTLIDDFVEHMYRITGSNDSNSHNLTCHCGDPESESPVFEEPLPGLKVLPGFKRKYRDDLQQNGYAIDNSLPSDVINTIVNFKRRKQLQHRQPVNASSPLYSSKSPCAVEGCLSKGFSGLFTAPRVQN